MDRLIDLMTPSKEGEDGEDSNKNRKKPSDRLGGSGDLKHGMSRFRNSQYILRAVICHRGNAESGHFVTFRRGPDYEAMSRYAKSLWNL
jgi:uncharacterized UBP type Zn finger protein